MTFFFLFIEETKEKRRQELEAELAVKSGQVYILKWGNKHGATLKKELKCWYCLGKVKSLHN